ncbi:hypothetical protein [Chryseolinea soli]|uniref:Uncharacterized protein n=1 Tax=Chryseolinea soli TaxID=2321403 RepID=A0A385SGV4_9BACT|nr:hypothetical protein [Chryseolinea soli]AYB30164.1 hypothetical protein D4L85_06030 [Chryseolinea soli]
MRKFAILIVWLAACHSSERKITAPDYTAKIRNLLITEFDLKDYDYSDLDSTLKYGNLPEKEIILHPGNYKLRLIEVYTNTYDPFVVKVLNTNDSLLFLFTFTDELHYRDNDFHASFWGRETIKREQPSENWTPPPYKKNLESNLNALIIKLGYQRDRRAIEQLLGAIFNDLLHMKPFNEYEMRNYNSILSKVKTNDPVIKQSLQEYVDLEKNYNGQFCVLTKDGLFGFWLFDLEENNEDFRVKVHFIGDLLYSTFYM